MARRQYLTAGEAAERLGVSRATLYAYVSRGQIRSEVGDESTRERRYHAEDVEALAARKTYRRDPAKAAQDALHWGSPMLDSALTLIRDHRLYYCGWDAAALAREASFEQTAALLWTGDRAQAGALFDAARSPERLEGLSAARDLPAPHLPTAHLPTPARMAVALAFAGADDLAAYDLSAPAVARTGGRIVRLLAAALTGGEGRGPAEAGIAGQIAAGWDRPDAAPLINAALILCADHELNASSFAARVAASTDANPYAIVAAGLAALTGFKHGGNTELTEAFLNTPGDLARAAADRLRRGERIPGFGHRLYPAGDPRAVALIAMMREAAPGAPVLARLDALTAVMREVKEIAPNIDLALAALARLLDLPPGASLGMFAVGRSVGWIAHAIEQYAGGMLIRPRARYVGEMPADD
ncbi:MAG: citrate synthase family protein [Anaerolineae bacterium]|nr:citrate synthase family protein [Anaerolineae bacterium]NUQ04230.1 helix-turn-helix domain-containing protein [Anaerolineae bacterium]